MTTPSWFAAALAVAALSIALVTAAPAAGPGRRAVRGTAAAPAAAPRRRRRRSGRIRTPAASGSSCSIRRAPRSSAPPSRSSPPTRRRAPRRRRPPPTSRARRRSSGLAAGQVRRRRSSRSASRRRRSPTSTSAAAARRSARSQLPIAGYVEEVEVTRDKTDQNITDNFSSALTQDQIDALPDDEEEMAEQLAADGRPRRGAARQRLLGRPPAAEVADRRDPLPLRSLFGREPRGRLPARRHPHPARQRQLAQQRQLHLPRRVAERAQRVRDREGARAGAPLPVLDGRPDQEGQDVVLVQHRRHGLVRHRDHPRRQPRRHGVRRHRVEADRSHQPQRPRRARHQQEPDAARRVLAQQQRPGPARRRRLRALRARLRSRVVRGNEVRISTSGPVFRKMRNEVRLEVDWNETVVELVQRRQ